MKWYYVHAGRQIGPVDELQLADLRRSGKILPDTLIWREGMPDWKPYREVGPAETAAAELPAGVPNSAAPVADTTREAVCAGCGQIHELARMTLIGESRLCPNCKPAHLKKLSEQARTDMAVAGYAGFWPRLVAAFIDGIVLFLILFILAFALSQSVGRSPGTGVAIAFFVCCTLVASAYETVLVAKFGATPGKLICKLKIVTPFGLAPSFPQALGRYLAKYLSALFCGAGFLLAAFDKEKRALHDRLCRTRVIFA